MRLKFQEWYAEQVAERITSSGCHVELQPVYLSLPAMKELGVKWLEDMYEYICDNPQFIVNGFLQAGIPQLWMANLIVRMMTTLQMISLTMKQQIQNMKVMITQVIKMPVLFQENYWIQILMISNNLTSLYHIYVPCN